MIRRKRRKQKQKRNVKKDGERKHAVKRFLERLGIVYNRALRRELIQKIANSDYKSAEKQTNRVTKFRMDIEENACIVIYDTKRGEIVTMYLEEAK